MKTELDKEIEAVIAPIYERFTEKDGSIQRIHAFDKTLRSCLKKEIPKILRKRTKLELEKILFKELYASYS